MYKTNLRLSDDVADELKDRAQIEGLSINQIIVDAVTMYLKASTIMTFDDAIDAILLDFNFCTHTQESKPIWIAALKKDKKLIRAVKKYNYTYDRSEGAVIRVTNDGRRVETDRYTGHNKLWAVWREGQSVYGVGVSRAIAIAEAFDAGLTQGTEVLDCTMGARVDGKVYIAECSPELFFAVWESGGDVVYEIEDKDNKPYVTLDEDYDYA